MTIRNVELKDAGRLAEIYSYYVENTAVSFEYVPPSKEEFEKRINKITANYPYIVAEEKGKILGYAYAREMSDREAYKISVEVSIYVDKNLRKKGVGRKLYSALENALKNRKISNLYACIASSQREDEHINNDSILFHEKMGYKKVGEFNSCGSKFGKKYNIVWMEKII